jgi:hypothetical protein
MEIRGQVKSHKHAAGDRSKNETITRLEQEIKIQVTAIIPETPPLPFLCLLSCFVIASRLVRLDTFLFRAMEQNLCLEHGAGHHNCSLHPSPFQYLLLLGETVD